MKEHVVTVHFNASVAGKLLHVHEASIVLGVNQIPRIELMVAPTNDNGATPLIPKVMKPSLSDFSDIYRDLANKAPGLNTKGRVHIDIYEDGAKKDEVDIRDWILTGVGMSSVSSTSAPYLSVILQHPICYLTKIGSIYEEPMCNLKNAIAEAAKGKSPFLKIAEAVYDCVKKAQFYSPLDGLATVFRMNLGTGVFDPQKYLYEESSKLFLEKHLNTKDILSIAIARFVLPTNGGSSTWDMLLSMSGLLLLSIVQDEAHNFMKDKLLLEPTKPWKSASINLSDEDCFQTDLPGMDSFKLIGVFTRKPNPFFDLYTLGMTKNGNADQTDRISNLFYSPFTEVKDADGRVMSTECPAVLAQAFMEDAAKGGPLSTTNIDAKEARASGIKKALMRYCQAVYEMTAASMNTATAKMILGFKDRGGKLILPGNTCKFTSNGKAIYYGYARQVVHFMSTKGGCSTTVSMTHVRPDEKYKLMEKEVIEDGNKNPAYD